MEFAQDWAASRARYEAWWRNDVLDRPVVVMESRREKLRWPLKPGVEAVAPERFYFDAQARVDDMENVLAATDYLGDAAPLARRGINTGYLGLFAGAAPLFAGGKKRTVWVEPFVQDWDALPRPRFDTEAPAFKAILEVSDALVERGRGRYLVAIPDHLDAVTTMSQMRGVEAMMLDIMDNPGPVCRFRDELTAVWTQSRAFWFERDQRQGLDGSSTYPFTWSSRCGGVTQCDFSSMISPAMFDLVTRPELEAEASRLDCAMYHLDGPGELAHVDALCRIPGITAIQWVPGAGRPRAFAWRDLLTTLQDRGKPIQVYFAPQDLDDLFAFLRPQGLMLYCLVRCDAAT
ncbi:MAG TPA: hypothetical protein P5137_10845, partial [Candidatus Brocadiia bacterium]|nr:hypothetical protein [Candidatus Brocadiia bacterium]